MSGEVSGEVSDDLETLLRVLPEATLLVTADGVIQSVNPAARRLLGPVAGPGARLSEHVTDPDAVAVALRSWSGSRQLLPAALTLRGVAGVILLRCDGGVIRPRTDAAPALLLVRCRTKDAATSQFRELTDRIDALTREVVRRRQAEREAAAQREWLEVTLTSIGDGVIATDRAGTVTFLNPAAERYTGWTQARAIGRRLGEVFVIVNEQSREVVENPVDRVIRQGVVVGLANHTLLVRPDGSELAIADSAAPIRDAGGDLIGVVLVFQDETTRRRNEATRIELLERERDARKRAEDASRMKDEFLATVSHELRTPLNAILGWAEMLLDEQDVDGEVARGIAVIARNARTQVRLIDELLDVARITSGRIRLILERIDVTELLMNAIDAVSHAAAVKRITLETEGLDAPLIIVGDATRLQQATWNLLTNAIKFSPEGERVRLVLKRSGSMAEIRVEDCGIGLEQGESAHVFEPFWQREPHRVGADRGLGLGLAIVQRIAEAHGGTVDATSEGIGKGATFRIQLPIRAVVASAEDAEEGAQVARRGSRTRELAGLRVLVVEDEADSREVLEMLLRARGAEVSSAPDASAALDVLDRWRPDVIVSDIAMPGMDGYELMRAVRARPRARGGLVPAVALTAFAGDLHKRMAEAAGFQRHLAKPAMPADVVAAIRDVIGSGS